MRALTVTLGLSLLLAADPAAAQPREPAAPSGTAVKALQQRLADGGCYHGAIDGEISPALQAAIAACPSQQPMLRIETGMHVAPLWGIAADARCRIVATASDDKTARVWSGADLHLLQTLRPPIGGGNGGKGRAVAVSPDGRYIATAGWDAHQDVTHQSFVYVFDAATGALVARPFGFTDVITGLAFSADGRWLAAVGGSIESGVRVFDTADWHTVMVDLKYHHLPLYAVAFGPDGSLYTAAFDRRLRRYGPGPRFVSERKVVARGGRLPRAIAVDPRGQFVAIGFMDLPTISVFDTRTLRFRFAADTRGADNDGLGAVAWSGDGERLVAGGTYGAQLQGKWVYPVLSFDRSGRRVGEPVGVDDSVFSMAGCGSGAVLVSGASFGFLDGNGRLTWQPSTAPDMRAKLNTGFTIAADAKQVRFGLGFLQQPGRGLAHPAVNPVLFDLSSGTLAAAPRPSRGFLLPSTATLPIAHWENDFGTTFAGRRLALRPGELAKAAAIRPDRDGFVLGTTFLLRAYAQDGSKLWEYRTPGEVGGVNISADGRVVVAAYADGTVRWHRWSDGKELLALFVDSNTKAWVAWTPSGYYMASPGGEDLIGWQINRGWNQAADFFPASRFRERFNRPDIVRLVLDTLDEDAAIKQANAVAVRRQDTKPLIARLPPIVRIASPAAGAHVSTASVTLDYVLRSPSGQPVDRLDLLINGRPVKSIGLPIAPIAPEAESKGSVRVTLGGHVSEVGLIAWSGTLASQAAHVKVVWDGAPEVTRKLYALVVGVSNYADPAMKLKYATKDAADFAKAVAGQKDRYYADVQTRVLTDRAVTRISILQGLQWLEKSATNPNDVSVLFLAGHGMTDEKQTYWFYTSDSNDDNVRFNGISQDELRKALQGLPGKVLWFLDTCHAGTAAKRPPVDMNVLVNTVSASENGGIVVFASSTGRQVSVETADLGNGAFTKAVVEGIDLGKAALGDGFITTSTLDSYVVRRVEEVTANKQTPVMERPPETPDFAIAVVRK